MQEALNGARRLRPVQREADRAGRRGDRDGHGALAGHALGGRRGVLLRGTPVGRVGAGAGAARGRLGDGRGGARGVRRGGGGRVVVAAAADRGQRHDGHQYHDDDRRRADHGDPAPPGRLLSPPRLLAGQLALGRVASHLVRRHVHPSCSQATTIRPDREGSSHHRVRRTGGAIYAWIDGARRRIPRRGLPDQLLRAGPRTGGGVRRGRPRPGRRRAAGGAARRAPAHPRRGAAHPRPLRPHVLRRAGVRRARRAGVHPPRRPGDARRPAEGDVARRARVLRRPAGDARAARGPRPSTTAPRSTSPGSACASTTPRATRRGRSCSAPPRTRAPR